MALVRWRDRGELSPWSALRDLEGQMNRMLGDWFREGGEIGRFAAPAVDLCETADAYVLEVDLPGMKKEDIDLSVMENMVTIKGERKSEHRAGEAGYQRFERQTGTFQRSFEIPGGFDGAKVEAQYENGVLTVKLPKREESKPRQINVNVK